MERENSDTYLTIASPSRGSFRDRGSRFLSFAFPVNSADEVKDLLAKLKKEYHDASQHCFAWRLGEEPFQSGVSDDREPSGSAGHPILGQLRTKNLTRVLLVVIRYFGGKLLGVRGLISAYKAAAADALNNAEIIKKTLDDVFILSFGYRNMNDVMKILKKEKARLSEQKFEAVCSLNVRIRKSRSEAVQKRLALIDGVRVESVRSQ
jgi:uncharacterized YigZ family protein